MPATKTARRTINMTPQLQARLRQVAETGPRNITEADLIRQAIREFLDRQEDIVGSRTHFRKTFQDRTDRLQADLEFHLHVIIALLAHGLAIMLPVFTEQPITPLELIQAAIISAQSSAAAIQAQMDAVRNHE